MNSFILPDFFPAIIIKTQRFQNLLKNIQNIKLIILAEGVTEKILLPAFSKVAGIDFIENGIKVISSGGKNRLWRLYQKLSQEVDLPIFMIFDSDAENLIEENRHLLRSKDDIYTISKGEFEDILPDKLICKAINKHYGLIGDINISEIIGQEGKAQILTDLYRIKGFGAFKKAEFAQILAGCIKSKTDLSEELQALFKVLKSKIHSQPAHKLYEK